MSSDKHDTENGSKIIHPVLLLGEGKADVSFFNHLATHRNIVGVHFSFPTAETGGFGNSGFGSYLHALPLRSGFEKLKAILLVYDNDDNPLTAFSAIRASIDAADPYSVPNVPMVLGDQQVGRVPLMFVPMPGADEPGALESLLLQSTATASAAALACIEELRICGACGALSATHGAKMRLRCLIAMKCPGNSDMALTNIWGKPGNPIDLAHTCFDALAETVRNVVLHVAT